MSRTIHHAPFDVQVRAAWGDTEPAVDIDPLTGEAWETRYFKGARADRVGRGVGTYAYRPGARIGGSNPSAHREYLGRPRYEPVVADYLSDDEAEAAYDAEQRELDELSKDLHDGALDDEWEDAWDEWDAWDDVYCETCDGRCRA